MSVDGRLFDSTTPTSGLLDSSVAMTIQILDPAKTCILYEEQQTVSTLLSDGYFNVRVGSPTSGSESLKRTSYDSGNSMTTVFGNKPVAIPGKSSSNVVCSYTPSTQESRYFRFIVTPSTTGVTSQLSPDMTIDSTPQALVAESLQGLAPTDFIQVNANTTQAKSDSLFGASYAGLTNLLSGTSSLYLKNSTTGTIIPNRATDPGSPVAGQIWYDTAANAMKFFDGSAVQTIGTGSGIDVTKLPLAGGTMTGDIVMGGNQITGAGHITQGVQSTLTFGKYTNAQEAVLTASLVAGNKGATWFNSDTNKMMYWDGALAQVILDVASAGAIGDITDVTAGSGLTGGGTTGGVTLSVDIGTGATQLFRNQDVPSCNTNQTLKMSVGPVYTLSCVTVDDTTKLAKAGGTMTGDITMGGNQLLNVSHITQTAQSTLTVGKYTNAQEAVLTAALVSGNKGAMWFNSDTNTMMYWDGTAAQELTNASAAGGDITAVVAGAGLTGGTNSGSATVDIGAGTGIVVNADDVAVDVGVTAGKIVQVAAGDKLPVIDGSNLTNITTGNLTGAVAVANGGTGQTTAQAAIDALLPSQGSNSGKYLTTDGTNSSWGTPPPTSLSGITAATSVNTIANANNAQTWNWDTLTTESAMSLASNSMTTGALLSLTDSFNSATSTGNVLKLNATGASNAAVPLMITNAGTGNSLRINDDGTDTDATPVVVDSSGLVGIGTTAPTSRLQIVGAGLNLLDLGQPGDSKLRVDQWGSLYSDGYLYAYGFVGGYLNGGGNASQNLTLESTTHSTKGVITLAPNGGNVGIGTTVPGTLLDVAGAITSRPLGTNPGETGQLLLRELAANGTNTAKIRSPDLLTADYVLTLPEDDGTANQVLTTDGSGVLTWASPSAATTVSATSGTAGAPSVSFSGDPDTGFYSSAANSIGVAAGGASLFDISSAGIVAATTGGGVVTSGIGTAATPTFSFAGDTDTGWWRPAADSMAASTAGTERVRIDSYGNVGIGSTAPLSSLDVSGGSISQQIAITESTLSGAILSAATSMTLVNASSYPNSGLVFLGGGGSPEIMSYASKSGNTLNGLKRGLFGTVAQGFSSGTQARFLRIASLGSGGVPTGFMVFGNGAAAIGTPEGNYLPGVNSLTVGYNSQTLGMYSLAQGQGARAVGGISFASGNAVTSNGWNSQAFGENTKSDAYSSMVLGRYNVGGGTGTSWVDTDPVFEIGIGTGTGVLRADAMTVLKNGKVGIGTTAPSSLLDVVGAITSRPLGTNPGETGQLILRELAANGTNTATLRSPDTLASDYVLTLPVDDGTANQVLTTDGSGVLTWASPTAATTVSASAGTAAAPSMSFSGDADTGFYSSSANTIGLAAGGVSLFDISSAGIVAATTGGGVVTSGNGIEATPTFSFAGDTDTGWWRPAADTMAASTGGSERLRIDSSGNVGIGTTSPLFPISIRQPTTNAYSQLGFQGTGRTYSTGVGNHAEVLRGVADKWYLFDYSGNAMRLTVDTTGRLGIGTTSPVTLLDVAGAITSRPYGTSSGNTGQLILRELAASGTNTATLRSPDSIAADYVLTLPVDAGTANQVLTTDGSGVLTWAAPSAATTVSASAGTVGAPSMSFSGDPDTGFYSNGANTIGVAAGGASLFNISSSGLVAATTGGGVMTSGNGTAATPTFSFAGDTGTGWWRPAASTLAASTGGAERLRIDSAGLVGIGTTTPDNLLSIYGNESSTGNLGAISLHNYSTSAFPRFSGLYFKANPSGGGTVYNASAFRAGRHTTNAGRIAMDLKLTDMSTDVNIVDAIGGATAGVSTMTLMKDGGSVGIGSSSPNAKLDVAGDIFTSTSNSKVVVGYGTSGSTTIQSRPAGTTFTGLPVGSDFGAQLIGPSSGQFVFDLQANDVADGFYFRIPSSLAAPTTVDTVALAVRANGNVGIGTNTPSAKLEVAGQIVSKQYTVATGATVDFSNGNTQILQSVGGTAITLSNMVGGGSYTLIVTDGTVRTYTFTNCTNSYFRPGNGDTLSGTRTVYTILAVNTGGSTFDCYISWISGFQ